MARHKSKKIEDTEVVSDHEEVTQNDLSDEDICEIRASLETDDAPDTVSPKKFVTGLKPNPPPKKSWWDKLEEKFNGGDTIVPISWDGKNEKQICRVCSPGYEQNTYHVKFYESRDESIIKASEYKFAPEGTVWEPYRDEYTKWMLKQKNKQKP
jgi:hypothetical protein